MYTGAADLPPVLVSGYCCAGSAVTGDYRPYSVVPLLLFGGVLLVCPSPATTCYYYYGGGTAGCVMGGRVTYSVGLFLQEVLRDLPLL